MHSHKTEKERFKCLENIETVGEPAALRLTLHIDDAGLQADGADVAYIDVEVTDDQGRIRPLADNKITFHTEGEAVFLGVITAENLKVRTGMTAWSTRIISSRSAA